MKNPKIENIKKLVSDIVAQREEDKIREEDVFLYRIGGIEKIIIKGGENEQRTQS